MKSQILRLLDVHKGEGSRVGLLLVMSFFMGVFLATISVASQTLFLQHYNEQTDLPVALLVSGGFGVIVTVLYNFFQNRIPFPLLATLSLIVVTALTAFIEFGEKMFTDVRDMYFLSFSLIIPFTFLTYLVFWGAFGRMFNLRQAKRLVGTVDLGAMFASFIAYFSIPELLKHITLPTLYTVALINVALFTVFFVFLSFRHINRHISFAKEKAMYKKITVRDLFANKYIFYMSLFVVISMMAMNFVDVSFLNVTTQYLDQDVLPRFISLFEGTIVVFGFLFQIVATDRITKEYGMRVSLLVNPLLIAFFTVSALLLGLVFGYSPGDNLFVVFFLIIAVSKLFIRSLKESLDSPTFKLYLLPIESSIRIDVQTKIEGFVTAFAMVIAGGIIVLITRLEMFSLILITLVTLPLLVLWYVVANRMHFSYRHTLQDTLSRGSANKSSRVGEKVYTISTLLEKQVNGSTEEKVIYALKLMEKLEPSLFETAIIGLADSSSKRIKAFANEKIQQLSLGPESDRNEIRSLAESAYGAAEDSDLLSISPDKLLRLSKSGKQGDRILAAKLLRKLIGQRTIFILLELLRDVDAKVRYEALYTARKVNRPETWPVLIELLGSPTFSHQAAAALKNVGEPVLPVLETAFHKSGQSELVMLRIVQIMGKIGSPQALQLLWKKADYPDKRIVKQILYSLRYVNYQAQGREARDVMGLLETEMSKAIWNLAALHELRDAPEFGFLREALREEITDNYDQISMLLSILYDPKSVQLVRENLESGDPDNIAFAMELLDLFIDPELKPKLLPLLDESPTPEKLKNLQVYFPRESYNPIQVINYILNRDYNQNNRWTKVCAIHASAYIKDFRVSRGLVAQMFNSDKLLQETAAWVIYNKDQKAYDTIAERLPAKDKKFLDASIENNQLLDGLDDGFFLFIEMVMFVKGLPAFRNINGLLLSDLADKITPLDLDRGEKAKFNADDTNAPIFIVAHGEIKLLHDNVVVTSLRKGEVYGELFQEGNVQKISAVEASERAVVFKINLMDFYFVMANHHELVQGLMKNVTEAVSVKS